MIAADAGADRRSRRAREPARGRLHPVGELDAAARRSRFDRTRVTSRDWDSYPILRFAEVPEIETVLLDRPGEPFLGAGEATQGPTPAAIANAIAHATGARLRRIPFTPERVREALMTPR